MSSVKIYCDESMVKKITLFFVLIFLTEYAQSKLFYISSGSYTFSIAAPENKQLSDLYSISEGTLLFYDSIVLFFNNAHQISGSEGISIILDWLFSLAQGSQTGTSIFVYNDVADSNSLSAIHIYPNISSNSYISQTYIAAGTQIPINQLSHLESESGILESTSPILQDSHDGDFVGSLTCTSSCALQYSCLLGCKGEFFESRWERRKHTKQCHSDKWETILRKLPFVCPGCGVLITGSLQMGRHTKLHDYSNYDDFFQQ